MRSVLTPPLLPKISKLGRMTDDWNICPAEQLLYYWVMWLLFTSLDSRSHMVAPSLENPTRRCDCTFRGSLELWEKQRLEEKGDREREEGEQRHALVSSQDFFWYFASLTCLLSDWQTRTSKIQIYVFVLVQISALEMHANEDMFN